MNIFFFLVPATAIVYTIALYMRTRRLLRRGAVLVSTARAFSSDGGTFSILVLGDSTAVGVGANAPEESIAGRLSSLLHASVENYAHSGAVVADLQQQLSRATRAHYDLVLIQVGGNDIIKLRALRGSDRDLDSLLSALKTKSDRVVLLTAGRLGYAPFFPRLIAPLMNTRSLSLRSLFMATAMKHDALYVDLLGMSGVFGSDPTRFYAADMLHLTGAGYGIWFNTLAAQLRTRWPELFAS